MDKNTAQKIIFTSTRPWLTEASVSTPTPTVKAMPDWYKQADKYAFNPHTTEYWQDPMIGGKIPTWKACPAMFDIMGAGYVWKTPCDVEFFINDQGIISSRITDFYYHKDFCTPRPPMSKFMHPVGYHQHHFAWMSDWGVTVPEGYSVMYTQPFNRFDLPFLTTSGIIDNDKLELPGSMPFFIREGFTGVIPAGTPIAQLFPFKRDSWESEIVLEDPDKLVEKVMENTKKYRVPDGGVYANQVWERRSYK